MENNKIYNLKIALIYGKQKINGVVRDGEIEKIYKDKDDTLHYFYMKDFLEKNLPNEVQLLDILEKSRNVNSLYIELYNQGHIIFAESTSNINHKLGIFYLPSTITNKQAETLKEFSAQLDAENYSLMILHHLYRDEDGIMNCKQSVGGIELLEQIPSIQKDVER